MILGITLLVFLVLQAAPGDQASSALGEGASEEAKQQYRQENGLNDPLVVQYFASSPSCCSSISESPPRLPSPWHR